MTTTLSQLDVAKQALSQAKTMDDILEIRDIAEAARAYAKAAQQGLIAQNYAAEIKLRAERKAGDFLMEMEKAKGAKGNPGGKGAKIVRSHDETTQTLSDLGINKTQSSRWQKVSSVPEDAFEELVFECNENGEELTQAKLLRKAGAGHVSQSTGENEWYTPTEWVEAARKTMGQIDLDPASCEAAQTRIKAERFFSIADDGLSKPWTGRVWLNPPYARDLCIKFTQKLLLHVNASDVPQACVLVNNATETAWFQEMMVCCSAICFPAGRISFLDKTGKPSNKPLQGQAILYFGNNHMEFKNAFEKKGFVVFVPGGNAQ